MRVVLSSARPFIDWSVSSAVLITDGVAAILGSLYRASSLRGAAREQRPRTPTASTDGAGGRTALVLSVSWAALVSPRAARGSLFVARAGNTASNAYRPATAVASTDDRSNPKRRQSTACSLPHEPETGAAAFSARAFGSGAFSTRLPSFFTLPFHSKCVCGRHRRRQRLRETVKQLLLQRGVFVLHLGVEHESRSIAALTAAAQQKR